MQVETRTPGRRLMWWALTFNSLLLLLWFWAVLWLSVPRHDICFAIHPAAAGCAVAERGPAAIGAAIVMAGVFAALVLVLVRTIRRAWLPWMLMASYAILALVLYRVVLYA